MSELFDEFSIVEENWQRISEVRDAQARLTELTLWFQAEDLPDAITLDHIEQVQINLVATRSALLSLHRRLIAKI